MAYSINPNLPKARAIAMQLLIREQLSLQIVANHCGVHRSTVWRWKQKWDEINKDVQLDNPNRPNRSVSLGNKLFACKWAVPTLISRPHTSPRAIAAEIVARVLELRAQLKRCAEVIWHHLVHRDRTKLSLSSVRRILKRHHCFDGARKKRVRSDNPRRPHVIRPGELVQTDTIHHVDPFSGRRIYIYTVIDLYSRMAYAEVHHRILPGLAAGAVGRASALFGFSFAMVQADNGPEYSRYFEERLHSRGIQTRHSRLGRPNDNAHIERFNRTIQEECIGGYWRRSVPLPRLQHTIDTYIDYYNTKRVHLGIQLRTPAEMLQRS